MPPLYSFVICLLLLLQRNGVNDLIEMDMNIANLLEVIQSYTQSKQ